MDFEIYHNPRWGKSRGSVKILEENNLKYSIIEYTKNGISQEEIKNICNILNTRPIGIVRTSDTNYKELNITPAEELDDSYMTNMIIQNPKILQRPIILKGKQGVIGRPPEKINDLLWRRQNIVNKSNNIYYINCTVSICIWST